jgi:hypothetical protein
MYREGTRRGKVGREKGRGKGQVCVWKGIGRGKGQILYMEGNGEGKGADIRKGIGR